jgi:uncharacterized protein YqjF (DUF2071 family)
MRSVFPDATSLVTIGIEPVVKQRATSGAMAVTGRCDNVEKSWVNMVGISWGVRVRVSDYRLMIALKMRTVEAIGLMSTVPKHMNKIRGRDGFEETVVAIVFCPKTKKMVPIMR